MKGISLRKAANPQSFSLLRWYAETLENYYPGRVKRVLVINPPFGTAPIINVRGPIYLFTSPIYLSTG